MTFICTANRARSPFAAAVLRRACSSLGVVVDSFGTLEDAGAPALPTAVRAARAFEIDLSEHRARSLAPGALSSSDLVIGFEPLHVAHAVVTGGAQRARSFLLVELARALGDVTVLPPPDSAELGELVAQVDAARPPRSGSLAIADPVGGSERHFLETYAEIERIVSTLAERLFGAFGRDERPAL